MFWYKIINYIKALPYKFKRTRVSTVYESDLLKLLNSLGILDQVKDGGYRCLKCGTVIDLDNLEIILLKDKKIQIICSDPNCFTKI